MSVFLRRLVGVAALLVVFFGARAETDGGTDEEKINEKTTGMVTTENVTTEQLAFFNKVKTGEFKKLGTLLGRLVEDYRENSEAGLIVKEYNKKLELNSTEGRVWVDAVLQLEAEVDESKGPLSELLSLGFRKRNCRKNVCSGSAPIGDLVFLAQSVTDLVFFAPILKPLKHTGSVRSNGDFAMETDKARVGYGVTGAGMMVCAISDSFNCLGGELDDVASGDLPSSVLILRDYLDITDCTDEGRALLQIVHDVAPGASLGFHTAEGGQDVFAQGIRDLAAAGCDVIVDDVTYFAESWFQDGEIAQAVDDVVFGQGVTYVTSAGNAARDAWDSNIRIRSQPYRGFRDSGCPYPLNSERMLHDFDSTTNKDPIQSIDLEANIEYIFVLQWDEPHASNPGSLGSTNDLDFYLYNSGSCSTCSCVSSLTVLASSVDPNQGKEPVEIFTYTPASDGTYGLGITLDSNGTAPRYMKWVIFKGGDSIPPAAIEYYAPSSTVVGHSNGLGAISVGAVKFSDTPEFGRPLKRRDYSSAGGTPIFFTDLGFRYTSEIMREHPKVMGPDGVKTTFFGRQNPDGEYIFDGTSASAPHVAGLAALMLQANPSLTPIQIRDLLQTYAIDMDDDLFTGFQSGFDNATGYGFVDGLRTIDAISPTPAPTTLAPTEAPCSCLSEATTVEVAGKGKVEIKYLRVGDEVLKGDDHYEPVYGFAHRHEQQLTEFLVFYTSETNTNSRTNGSTAPPSGSKPLEISPNHLLQVDDTFLPAKDVQVGHILSGEGNITVTVTGIEVVRKEGLFAPLTPSGTLLVNGIQVSCYVSLQKHLGHASIHLLITPVRMICLHAYGGAHLCSNDWTDEETGFPPYVVFAIGLLDIFDQQHLMVQILLCLIFLAIMLPLYGLEQVWLCFGGSVLWAVVVVSTVWVSKWKEQPSTKTRPGI